LTWFLDLRTLGQGGPVGSVKLTDGQTILDTPSGHLRFQQEIQGRDVLFVTHGFENNRAQGTAKLEEWKKHLAIHPEPVFVGVLWPGDGILHLGIDYIWEGGEAEKSGTELGQYIDANCTNANSVSFASHSLGARVILQAVRQLTRTAQVRNLFLMAGAIENDTLIAEYADSAARIQQISVFFSSEDHVLQRLYPAGNLVGRLLQLSHPNIKVALGRAGSSMPAPASLKHNFQIPLAYAFDHSDYLSDIAVTGNIPAPINPLPSPSTPLPNPPHPMQLWKPCFSASLVSTFWT
jgi:hypothetical protein